VMYRIQPLSTGFLQAENTKKQQMYWNRLRTLCRSVGSVDVSYTDVLPCRYQSESNLNKS
jgi:cytolysin (calcineurin-like family phosphatase)